MGDSLICAIFLYLTAKITQVRPPSFTRHADGHAIYLHRSKRAGSLRCRGCVHSLPDVFAAFIANYSDFALSQERRVRITSALRSRGNQWPEGRVVTVRSWHA